MKNLKRECFSTITQVYKDNYPETLGETAENPFLDSVRHILNTNVILGDRLIGLRVDGSGLEIFFSEYSFEGEKLIQKDFAMNDIDCSFRNVTTNH